MSQRREPPESGHYEVGYRRPPAHSRFKKGTSGNPRGRPKKSKPGLGLILAETLNEKVSVREGEKVRRISKGEMVVRAAVNAAMKGERQGLRNVMMLAGKTGLLGTAAPHAANPVLVVPGAVSEEDWLAATEKHQAPYRGNNGE
jgi:hypothetical protein